MFLQNVVSSFASTATCTVNGQPASCGGTIGVLLAVFVPLGIIFLVLLYFWVKSLIHVIGHEDVPNRVLWLILHFVGLGLLCGVIYTIFVKRPYEKSHVGQMNNSSAVPQPQQPVQPPQQFNPPQSPQPPTPPTTV